jgi:hypothetical protein
MCHPCQSSPWGVTITESMQRDVGGVKAHRFAADIVRSVSFFDIVSDMRVMSRLGRNVEGAAQQEDVALGSSTSPDGCTLATSRVDGREHSALSFQERIFGMRRSTRGEMLARNPVVVGGRAGTGRDGFSNTRREGSSIQRGGGREPEEIDQEDDDGEEEVNFEV